MLSNLLGAGGTRRPASRYHAREGPTVCSFSIKRPRALLTFASATLMFSVDMAYQHIPGSTSHRGSAHCGGTNVSPLADGTVYGWTGDTVEQCKVKCTTDPSCNAFDRRDSDGACHWKTGASARTVKFNNSYSGPLHSCYLQKQGTCAILVQFLTRHLVDTGHHRLVIFGHGAEPANTPR